MKEVRRIHALADLWELVLAEAKSKVAPEDWANFDIQFLEKCIAEFHDRVQEGFAFAIPVKEQSILTMTSPIYRRRWNMCIKFLKA